MPRRADHLRGNSSAGNDSSICPDEESNECIKLNQQVTYQVKISDDKYQIGATGCTETFLILCTSTVWKASPLSLSSQNPKKLKLEVSSEVHHCKK